MTQDVRITDLTGIPQWATETTLQRIEKILGGTSYERKQREKQQSRDSKDQTLSLEQINERLAKLIEEAKKPDLDFERYFELDEEIIKEKAKLSEETKKLNNNLKPTGDGFLSLLWADVLQLGGAFGRVNQQLNLFHAQRFPNISRWLGRLPLLFQWSIGGIGVIVGLLTRGIGRFIRLLQDSTKVQRDFFEMGVAGFRSMSDFYFQLSKIGTTSAEFAEIVQGAATAVGTFGVDAIPRITESLDNLEQLGLTSAAAAKFVAQNLEQQRLAGLYSVQTETQQQESMQRSIQQLTAFSQILNVSRQEIQKTVTEMLEQDQIRAALMRLRDGEMRTAAAEGLQTVVGLFAAMGEPGKKFAGLFGDMVGALDPLLVEGLYDFIPFAGQATLELANLARGVRAGRFDQDQATEGVVAFAQALEQQSDMITYMAGLGDQSARQASAFLAQWREATHRLGDISGLSNREIARRLQQQRQELSSEAEAMIALDNATRRIRTTFIATLAAFFQGLAERFGGVENIVMQLTVFLETITERLLDFLEGYIDELTAGEVTIGKTLTVFAGVIASAIASAFMQGIRAWVDEHGGFWMRRAFGTPKKSDQKALEQPLPLASMGFYYSTRHHARFLDGSPEESMVEQKQVKLVDASRIRRWQGRTPLSRDDFIAANRAIQAVRQNDPEALNLRIQELNAQLENNNKRSREQTEVLCNLLQTLDEKLARIQRNTGATAENTG